MLKALIISCVILCFLMTCSRPRKDVEHPVGSTHYIEEVQKEDNPFYLEQIQEEIILSKKAVEAEKEIAEMTKDIKDFWIFYYELDMKCKGCKKAWPIRKRNRKAFDTHSKELAEIVYYFKRKESTFGGKLPMHKDTHIFLAMMVVKETAVDPNARGKLGEVGLIQIHRDALQGHKSKEILEDPRLGLYLGVDWIASKFKTCWKNLDENNWENKMWYYPLTIYAAGEGDGRARRGKCTSISIVRSRVNMAIRYLDKKKSI